MRNFTITKVERAPGGYWTARVTPYEGKAIRVNRRFGSWMVGGEDGGPMRSLLPSVAVALQERIRPLEKAESKRLAAPAAEGVGRVRARVSGANLRASPESNARRVPSRLS